MKKPLLFLILILLGLYLNAQSGSVQNKDINASTKWMQSKGENAPGKLKAFEENKGQFYNSFNSWKVLYGCDYNGTRYLFTDKGLVYYLPESIRTKNDEDKIDPNKREAEEFNIKLIMHTVSEEWDGCSSALTVQPIGEETYYTGSTDPLDPKKSIEHIKSFEKLIYHNVYPGIDIEYSFADSGIESQIIVNSGYSLNTFKLLLKGQKGLSVDNTGDLHITTKLGDIIEPAPYVLDGNGETYMSFKKLSNNTIELENNKGNTASHKASAHTPWTITPTTSNAIYVDVSMDAANNVYILGAYAAGGIGNVITMYEQKYAAANGALLWQYKYTQYNYAGVFGVTSPSYLQSDLAVDPAGNSYVPCPFQYSNSNGNCYAMISLNTAGTLVYFNNNYNSNTVYEVWNIAYSCSYSTLVQGGAGPNAGQGELSLITPSTGNLGGVYNATVNSNPSELYAGCVAPNGNYYTLASNLTFTGNNAKNTLLCWNIAGASPTLTWKVNSGYSFDDWEAKNPYGVGDNGIAASCAFLYTFDGATIQQRSLTTGAINLSAAVPGGTNSTGVDQKTSTASGYNNSGVAVDLVCGYVYVGSIGSVQVFDANLNPVTSYAVPAGGIVYGVTFNNGIVAACGATQAGVGFVAQFAAQKCPGLTITHVNTTCNLANGTANLSTPTFCSAPYNYTWSNGASTQNVTGLAAGIYTVNVGTQGGCVTESDTVTIAPSVTPTVTATSVNELCNGGSTGSVSLGTTTGGVAPYSYSWSGGQTTTTVSGLPIGTYTLTAKDNDGCTGTGTATITQPAAIVVTTATTPTTCSGSTGTASVTNITGGTAAYTYLWNGGQTTSTISNLGIGTYSVTVTDANSCTQKATVTVGTSGATITPTTSVVNVLCNGGTTGSVSVTGVTGGATPYTYAWNGGQTTTTVTGLGIGTYTVIATDANGCAGQATATITQPAAIVLKTDSTPTTCTGTVGTAGLTSVTGGTAPYSYSWNGGQTTSTISNLAAGSYTVTVTDKNLCTQNATVVVLSTGATITPTTTVVNELCNGSSTGSVSVTGSTGGAAPYTYSWSGGQTTTTVAGLPIGTYTVTSKDANGCVGTATATITQPTVLKLSASASNASCFGVCNGQLISIPTPGSGTGPYSYLWSNGITTASQLNVCAGTYSIVVTDANGCTIDSTGLVVSQPTQLAGTATPVSAQCNMADGSACITATAGSGTSPYTYSWSNGITTTCINNIIAGPYYVVITDANKCIDTVKTTVPNTSGDTVVITASTNVTCNGNSNGSATASASGGTLPYTYSWSTNPVQTTPTASNLIAGTYTITVKDGSTAGCPATTTVTITQPAVVVATPPAPQTICMNDSATLTVSAVGGTAPYTYTWMPSNLSGATVTVKPTGTTIYTITTVDVNNCPSAPVQVVVTVNPPLSVTVTPNKATCPGGSVNIGAKASGGDGIYTYTWTPTTGLSCANCQNTTVTPTATTQYTVWVSDNCGTTPVKDSVTVTVDPVPNVLFKADTLAGCWPLCVTFTDETTISSGSLSTWAWTYGNGVSFTQQAPAKNCYGNPGVYTVGLVVTSDSGCPDSLIIPNMITVYSHPTAAFTASPQPATIIAPLISFTDQSTDAYGITNWAWQFGDPLDGTSTIENPQYTYADTGTYCPQLIVTNKHGCMDTVQHCIVIEPYFTLYIPNAFTPNGDGLNDVFTAKGTYVCGFDMYIFDRWGMQLYYTEDMNKGWNGHVNGGANTAQEDTYVYLIEAIDCVQHNKHQYIGKVTLIK